MRSLGVFCALLALVLSISPSEALVTLYVNTASTAGGDCTTNATSGSTRACATLRQAIDLLPGTLTDQTTIYCSGSTADTGDVNQTPWDMTTTATNYLHIIGEQSPNHPTSTPTGVWDTNKYRIECTNKNCLYNNIPEHIRFEGLQVHLTINDSSSYVTLKTTNANQNNADIDNRVAYSIVRCTRTAGSGIGIESRPSTGGTGESYIYNNLIYGCTTGINLEFPQTQVYNNTVVNNQFNILANASDAGVVINNIAAGTADQHFLAGGSFSSGSGFNAAPDTSPPGSNNVENFDFTGVFVNAGADNYHLASDSTDLADSGAVDPGSGLYSDDMEGHPRGAAWAIGADEFFIPPVPDVRSRVLRMP